MNLLNMLTFALIFSSLTFAGSAPEELRLKNVFVISNGYDDNDTVEAVITGELPDICYDLAETKVESDNDGLFIIRQYMTQKNSDQCELIRSTHESEKIKVSFTQVVKLGILSAGSYSVKIRRQISPMIRRFEVIKATNNSVDNMLYAPITTAFIPELVYESTATTVIMTGIFSNTCMKLLEENISIIRDGNIFIILPEMKIKRNGMCQQIQTPLQSYLDLGALSSGEYLLHIRSASGKSINRVFNVIQKPFAGHR
jgi:hypothetical protein